MQYKEIPNKRDMPQLILQLVISHLDYANSMLEELPSSSTKIMQKVQNIAAKLILRKNAMESTTECLKAHTGYQYNNR